MARAKEIRTDMHQPAESIPMTTFSCAESARSTRRVSTEQEQADFAAWLREYRRWTQSGCCAGARNGDIEWGGEDACAQA